MSDTMKDKPRYWFCMIGPVPDESLPLGADFSPRLAAREKVFSMTGIDSPCTSGWIDEDEYKAHLETQRPFLGGRIPPPKPK